MGKGWSVQNIIWQKQSTGWVGSLRLLDGRAARVVLIGPRDNPKGAVLVIPSTNGGKQVETLALSDAAELLHPACVVETMSRQERVFGNSGLPAPATATD